MDDLSRSSEGRKEGRKQKRLREVCSALPGRTATTAADIKEERSVEELTILIVWESVCAQCATVRVEWRGGEKGKKAFFHTF